MNFINIEFYKSEKFLFSVGIDLNFNFQNLSHSEIIKQVLDDKIIDSYDEIRVRFVKQ